ncbi:MAG: response regulator [Elusimicrobia bacterium]|nr:response regulator [Elusimicrobiota bacterium]
MPGALILVVDDEHDFRVIARHVLERGGYRVETASDGEEALRRFDALRPDLVVLDGHLPDLDGFEVCRRLRARPSGAKVPILLCTVRSALSTVAEGLAAGADGYVLKPFEMEELLARVAAALKGGGARP